MYVSSLNMVEYTDLDDESEAGFIDYLYGLLNIAYDMIFPWPVYLECAGP